MSVEARALACDTCPVRDRAACAVLSESERAALARQGHHRTLTRGERLFAAGDPNDHCATLISGALKIVRLDEDGTEHVLALVHPSGFVGEMFGPYAQHDVVALGDAKVCLFAASAIDQASERHPALARALLSRAREDLVASRELLALASRQSARDKVAGLLLALANGASASPCHPAPVFDLPISRADMAAMLGLTIETVSRQLGALEADGFIKRHGRSTIEVRDRDRLAQGLQ